MPTLRAGHLLFRLVTAAAVCGFLFLAILAAGCGSSAGTQPAPAPTVTLTANPANITAGSSSTLTASATTADQIRITGSDGSSYTIQGDSGTQSVSPASTTTYTATAVGAGGTATATATVTVAPPGAPTVNIVASPTSVAAGSASTLTVTATNATQVVVTGSDGSSYTLPQNGGTQSVSPSATTTYTATATGAGGKATATATVTVQSAPSAPTVTISASPATIAAGASAVLTVAATNATQVTVAGSDGSSYTLQSTGGTQNVSPSATTTYTATATGPGGTVTATATVTVSGSTAPAAPTVTIAASPASIASGGSSTLTVTAANATQVTVTGSDGSSYTLQSTGGTQAVSPKSTTTYTATAVGTGGTATAKATVTVAPAPTVGITAASSTISQGSSTQLTVTATNATQVVVTGTDGSTYTLSSTGGTQTVMPTNNTTYTATATGPGGTAQASVTITVTAAQNPTVTIIADPTTIDAGGSSTLTVTAGNASSVTVTGTDGSSYTFPSATGGTHTVTPSSTTTYTATAYGADGNTATATATATVTVGNAGVDAIDHVIFMMQENHTFDDYFGMLNPYRDANGFNTGADGNKYEVDGITDTNNQLRPFSNQTDEGTTYSLFKFTSTCIDDETSAWLESYGDVNRYDFSTTRSINMDGFVHTAENFAKNCNSNGGCSGNFTDTTGQRSMGYYDQDFLNYYYYMASQFALSDRWFSPVASKTVDNRIATMTGGTTGGLTKDPGSDDHLSQLDYPTIFEELDQNHVSWKIYYTVTQGDCLDPDDSTCDQNAALELPATDFIYFTYSTQYVYEKQNPSDACVAPTVSSDQAVGDPTHSFCIDPTHIAPVSQFFTDMANNQLPSFAFIAPGFGNNDEHPGSGQSILAGQAQMAKILNTFMTSPVWHDSVFFLAYDEGGGPFDHVPPVPDHSNDYTEPTVGSTPVADIPDISSISVSPDQYSPCLPPNGTATMNCDLLSDEPGANTGDAAHNPDPTNYTNFRGFGAQLGFRVPNMVISPFTRKHYVSHIPMDHTAIIKFVEDRFIGPNASLTQRDAVQPNLLNFFDFSGAPWSTPPTPPTPISDSSFSTTTCQPTNIGP